jgi:hypothetical protein
MQDYSNILQWHHFTKTQFTEHHFTEKSNGQKSFGRTSFDRTQKKIFRNSSAAEDVVTEE